MWPGARRGTKDEKTRPALPLARPYQVNHHVEETWAGRGAVQQPNSELVGTTDKATRTHPAFTESRSFGHHPTHPFGLYPQHAFAEERILPTHLLLGPIRSAVWCRSSIYCRSRSLVSTTQPTGSVSAAIASPGKGDPHASATANVSNTVTGGFNLVFTSCSIHRRVGYAVARMHSRLKARTLSPWALL